MLQHELQLLVNRGLSTREIAKELNCSQTNVRFWLRKYTLKTTRLLRGKRNSTDRLCKCGENDVTKFYGRSNTLCSACANRNRLEAGRSMRRMIIAHLGGKCAACGFCEYAAALHAHHTDPTLKHPNFNRARLWSWARVEDELRCCILLCANCHAGLHSPDESLVRDKIETKTKNS